MCDSHISESCPTDFTSYCPVDSIYNGGRHKQSSQKLHGNQRAPKRMIPCGSDIPVENRPSEECVRSELIDGGDHCRQHMHCGLSASGNSRSLEKASSYVSQEELNALKGCVMRRRAVFSPSPSSSPYCKHLPYLTNSLPIGSTYQDEIHHVRQSSLEYDHLKDFDPHPIGSITDSISVQFRLAEAENYSDKSQEVCHCKSNGFNDEAPEMISHENQGGCNSIHSKQKNPQTFFTHADSFNSWPRKVYDESGGKVSSSPLTAKSNLINQSPFHSKFNSPILPKHQLYSYPSK